MFNFIFTLSPLIFYRYVQEQVVNDTQKIELFHLAFLKNDIQTMDKMFVSSPRNNYYIDVSLEEGRKDVTNLLLSKGVKPSLFALQMAKINGHDGLAMNVEGQCDMRNKVDIKKVYYLYDRYNKTFSWSPIIPNTYRY